MSTEGTHCEQVTACLRQTRGERFGKPSIHS